MKGMNILWRIGMCLLLAVLVQANSADVSGKWEVNMVSDHGEFSNMAVFEQDGEKITVTMDESKGEGTLVGNEIKWTITLNTPMGDLDASFTGTVEEDSMNGDAEISGMTLEWTGIKIE
ncbi:MAG: hypothetical protein JRJ02_08700 [Deltaproteobacteria bacterium]|nr:hypothetical protein [Deltaproteobacteria bacterium]